ncbi:MAG: hypothetical protein JKX97_01195 [Candidatus Lindowbacteria bacterium]|nr:hypothetical protein [Candidatus Lindowbacteria bacterium]
MRSHNHSDQWIGEAMEKTFIRDWTRKGLLNSNLRDAKYRLLGEYWIEDGRIDIYGKLMTGLRSTKRFHWNSEATGAALGKLWIKMLSDVNYIVEIEGFSVGN